MKLNPLSSATSAILGFAPQTNDRRIHFDCKKGLQETSGGAIEQMNCVSGFAIRILEKFQHLESDIINTAEPLTTNEDGSIHCSITPPSLSGARGIMSEETTLFGKFESLLDEVMFACECMVAGDKAAQHAAGSPRVVPAEIRAAKSSQKLRVEYCGDGNIYVTNPTASTIVKSYLSLITAAARVNSLGMPIVFSFGTHQYHFPVMREGATKITPIVVGTRIIIAPVTGYFRRSRTAEFSIDGKVKVLKANEADAGLLMTADRTEASVEMLVEVSRPSNPFLGNEESFRIIEVLKVTNVGKQERLALLDV